MTYYSPYLANRYNKNKRNLKYKYIPIYYIQPINQNQIQIPSNSTINPNPNQNPFNQSF